MPAKTFDIRSYTIAFNFLDNFYQEVHQCSPPAEQVNDLAVEVQTVIEEFIEDLKSET
jgi:hypothetical protein